MKNLTEHLAIRHAFERKLGHGAMKKFADKHGYSLPYISQTIAGERSNEKVLKLMASFLGCRVHGVFPDRKYLSKQNVKQQRKTVA